MVDALLMALADIFNTLNSSVICSVGIYLSGICVLGILKPERAYEKTNRNRKTQTINSLTNDGRAK